jgi:acetyl esterase/lipase
MLDLDIKDIEDAERMNAKLARAPRFKISRLSSLLMQSLLRLSQLGADRRIRRSGLLLETRRVNLGEGRASVRVIRPTGAVRGVVLDFHGGGWVIGNARMNDRVNEALIRACDVAVVSVDYRLFGSTKIQGLIDDCVAAALWVLRDEEHAFAGLPIIVVGESAGAHLAAVTLLQLKAKELLHRIAGAVLYYGIYDLAGTASVRNAGSETLVLDGPTMLRGLRLITPELDDADRRRPSLSPLYAELSGLPPALMFVGELDPLRDDTLQMAERWRAAAEVEMHLVPKSPHGLIQFSTRIAGKVLARSHAWINERVDTCSLKDCKLSQTIRPLGSPL